MKNYIPLILLMFIASHTYAQQISLTFDNAEITTSGSDHFYEVDVLMESDVDFTLGEGAIFFDYNTDAFGTNIINQDGTDPDKVTFDTMGGAIGGGAFGGAVPHYESFGANDNTPSRALFFWFQSNSAGTIGVNFPATTPTLVFNMKIKMTDETQPPNISFATLTAAPFDTPLSSACGPYSSGFANGDCTNNPGASFAVAQTDDSGSNPIGSIDYVWDGSIWTPGDPSGVSTGLDNISIQGTGAIVSASTTANDFVITTGSDLSLGIYQLSISGDFTADGTLNANSGTLALTGTESQLLFGDLTVGTLRVNNAGTVSSTLTGNINVLTRLVLTDGDLDVTNGSLTLKSTSTTTAHVAAVVDGGIVGNVTVERYIQGSRRFRFLASSLDTSGSINANWQEGAATAISNPVPGYGTHISGSITGASGFDQTGLGSASMFGYDNVSQSWTAVTNTNVNLLDAGTAYRLFVRGSRSVDLTSNSSASDATVLRATGTLRTADVVDTFVTDANEGASEFMFTGNPYAAPVNMFAVTNNMGAGTQNLNDNFMYVWDSSAGSNGAYVTVDLVNGSNSSGSTANQFLQPGQSVFMGLSSTVSGTSTGVTYTQGDIDTSASTTNVFARDSNDTNRIVAQLKDMNLTNGNSIVDSFKIDFALTNSNAVDSYDALKLTNLDENMAVVNGSSLLSIERRELPVHEEQILMNFSNYRASNYVLSLDTSEFITASVTAFLQDNFWNTTTALATGINDINISVSSSDASSAANRFSIVFRNTVLSNEEINTNSFTLFPNPVYNGAVTINAPSFVGQKVAVTVSSILGQQVYAISTDFDSATLQLDTFTSLPVGMYVVTLSSGDHSISRKIVKK
jgi:hypothetical protein